MEEPELWTAEELAERAEIIHQAHEKLLFLAKRAFPDKLEFEYQEKERKLEEKIMAKTSPLILPAVSLSAEYLVMGHLLRRNILTYKAPPNNAGYDLICIHPDPKVSGKHIRIQVKSRYQTDCDWKVPVRETTFEAFDFLAVVMLNIGNFYDPRGEGETGAKDPEIYFLPPEVALKYYSVVKSGFNRVDLNKLTDEEAAKYELQNGIELIAQALNIPYPDRPQLEEISESEAD